MAILTKLTELWRVHTRVVQAKRLVRIAQRISASQRTKPTDQRPLRLYRRALRTLDATTPAGSPGWDSGPGAEPESIAAVLDRRLAEAGITAWLRRHRTVLSRRVAPALIAGVLFLMILVAAVPPFRRLLFPVDLAEGRAWTASSAIPEYSIRGLVAADPAGNPMFHTVEEPSPWLVVDLGRPRKIHEVRVTNRSDCCFERALPLAVETSLDGGATWSRVAYRRLPFTTWRAVFPTTRARLVRLRVDRQSMLHLALVAVY